MCILSTGPSYIPALHNSWRGVSAGKQQEELARMAGFAKATHYEIGFGLMGTLVASKR